MLYWLDLAGTFVFAVSGVLRGIQKEMDMFGMLVLAVATASGGGALRSIMIGDYPIPFLKDPNYLIVCVLATCIVFYYRNYLIKKTKAILFFDAFGLSFFLSSGVTIALSHHLGYWASILLGIVTASFGGVIRDVLCADVPLIFKKELYATAALAGGLVYIVLFHFKVPQVQTILMASSTVLAARLLAIKYDWSLPR